MYTTYLPDISETDYDTFRRLMPTDFPNTFDAWRYQIE
jgi:hypothetical protein